MFSDGLSLMFKNNSLVDYGIIKTSVLKSFGISQKVFYADFNWDLILNEIKNKTIKFSDITKYPEVRRDFALMIDESIHFKDIYEIAMQTEKKLLKNLNLFDVYEGDSLPKGKKSYAISFTLQDERKTLTDKQIEKIMNKLQLNFEKQLGAELR